MKLLIRDGHAKISGDKTEYEMPSGSLDIIADDGRTLFSISRTEDGCGIQVSTCGWAKVGKTILDDGLVVRPRARNLVYIIRDKTH